MAFFANVRRLFGKGRESNRLDIRDMMSMSDEELGRKFREHGEWNTSEKGASINDTADSVMQLSPFEFIFCTFNNSFGYCFNGSSIDRIIVFDNNSDRNTYSGRFLTLDSQEET